MAQTLANGIVVPNSDGGEAISATGVAELRAVGTTADVALGALRGTALAAAGDATAAAVAASAKADAVASASVARDDALADEIAGMEGMKYVGTWSPGTVYRINDVVSYGGDSWARLTAGTGPAPSASSADWGLVARKGDGGGFGELAETAVDGLYDTVPPTDFLYDSGWRNITGLLAEAPTAGRVLLRRIGKIVHLQVDGLTYSSNAAFKSWGGVIAEGFRPPIELDFAAGRRLASDPGGSIRINRITGNGFAYQVVSGNAIRAIGSWVTDEAQPVSLPGTAA